ncbi:rust resistance kinase Lr10-like isoform X1 [Chenopodium quinoa]|uniref:rust resistance kinase Lr10-like isoform X1 n=1 Tax=Chenopodium quinoa TaxID=63459 RepID=UPI000B76DA2E|nr:rust resistance kinase Lr10-like isoform X1 [Chenopodium quinoa]
MGVRVTQLVPLAPQLLVPIKPPFERPRIKLLVYLQKLQVRNKFLFLTMRNQGIPKKASVVVSAIATIAIVIAIIYCLKRTGDSLPKYAQAQLTVGRNNSSQQQQNYNFNNEANITYATMERFLGDIAREQPTRFSATELTQCTRNFTKVLGSGGFGVVYKGEFPNGIHVAVKVLKENVSKKVEEQFMAEVSTMCRTYHINLVRLYGFCFDPTMKALVYEYMEQGSLDNLLFRRTSNNITYVALDKLQDIAIGTARGIAYLHEECQKRIIHYDIKPGNVLLDATLNPKVADFGLAMLCNRDNTHVVMSGCRGTPGYAAPELWTPYPVTHKCDVYSFGMLLFEIVGRRRNHDTNLSGTSQEWLPRWAYERFDKGELAEMLSLVGIEEDDKEKAERMVKVALWCVQYLPNARPMMSSVVKMLEGGVSIDSPPNPFAHLQDNFGLIGEGDSNSSSTKSTSPLTKSESSNLEIQVANTY